MTILLTGGAGFIGSHLADKLLELGYKVCVIDNFDPYYERRIKEHNIKHNFGNEKYIFIEGDIRDTNLVKETIKKHEIDRIFHIAARAGVRFSVEDPYSYHNINVNGTLSLLKASLESRIKRIVFSSSSSVYGIKEYLPVDENHPTKPISPYGASKVACEAFCNSFMHVFGLPIVILRYFTVYGPRQRPDMAIHKFFRLAFEGKPIQIYGDGNQTRDFTFVSDIINGTIKAMESNVVGTFNLGSGKRISMNDLVKIIEDVTGKEIKKEYLERQKGDVPDTWADIRKAKRAFGYHPRVEIRDGIKIFYRWFEENVVSSNSSL
ncbi:MAG: SDR family NAD(P)-dependent oxidoreductase [Candidatus Aenigmarchaeota archaeon]|nr:SDR family NAD(P)-dependent oxidoreductase [Candidatus Aenigmarchaeota archaeon]